MRDYSRFDQYLDSLTDDIYAQPPDSGHYEWAVEAMGKFLVSPREKIANVLDVGCGHGFLAPLFEDKGIEWTGVAIGEDVEVCREKGLNVHEMDMTFLDFPDHSFDMVFARHVLEHSPFPIITLMEWRRVARIYLALVAPAPHYWGIRGQNHYCVVNLTQLKWYLARAGWRVLEEEIFTNRDERFLKYLEPYQAALKTEAPGSGKGAGKNVLERYPEGPVEYRLLCFRADQDITGTEYE